MVAVDSSAKAYSHCAILGAIVGDLQSLEVRLRSYLYLLEVEEDSSKKGPEGLELWKLKKGDTVVQNSFTNFDTLGTLIRKYNNCVQAEEKVGPEILAIRDLLAHGRTSSPQPTLDLRIFKFSKEPNGNGEVQVTHAEDMTPEWLAQKKDEVLAAMKKVGDLVTRQMALRTHVLRRALRRREGNSRTRREHKT